MNERQMKRYIICAFCRGHITEFDMRAACILLDLNGVDSAAGYMDHAMQRERVTQDAGMFAEVTQ